MIKLQKLSNKTIKCANFVRICIGQLSANDHNNSIHLKSNKTSLAF